MVARNAGRSLQNKFCLLLGRLTPHATKGVVSGGLSGVSAMPAFMRISTPHISDVSKGSANDDTGKQDFPVRLALVK